MISKYNVTAEIEGKKLIFNSLRNTYTVFNENFNVKKYDKSQEDFLIGQGIIVSDEVNEEKEAFIKYIEKVDEKILNLTIMPTMACNFRCSYCYEEHDSARMTDAVIQSIISFVKNKIKEVNGVSVSWFGGEPTLCVDIIEKISVELIKICKFYRKPYIANMTTNGYILDAELIKKFLKFRIVSYQITLDGDKEEHDSIRFLVNKNGTYDRIRSNLQDIRDNVPFPNIGIMLRINVTKKTFETFDQTIRDLEQDFGNDERFTFLFRRVGDWGGSSVKSISNNLVDSESDLTEKLLKYNGRLRINSQVTEYSGSYGICYAGKKYAFVISPAGQVLKCTVNLDAENNVVGYLEQDGKLKANSYMNEWRYVGGYNNYIPEKCKNCPMWANCFNNTCTAATLKTRVTSTPVCERLEENLVLMYKMFPHMFKTMEGIEK